MLEWSTDYFQQKGVPNPRLDSELLLAHVLRCRRIDLYIQFDRPLSSQELDQYRELVRARLQRQPVAYILQETEFWSLPLTVRPGCLVPRQDTETLVELALKVIGDMREAFPTDEQLRVVELGVGSGAIPLAVCSEAEGIWWAATDISPLALSVANENRARHQKLLEPRSNKLHLLQARDLEGFSSTFRPHLVISNPPYIASADIDGLEPEVAMAEPRVALDGGPDGLDPHRTLLDFASRQLVAGGHVMLEIGFDQGPSAKKLVEETPGLQFVEVHKDYAGNDRVLHALKP